MNKTKNSRLITTIISSIMAAFISKELLTQLLLSGKAFSNRSPYVQAGLLAIMSVFFFAIFWKLFPIAYSWIRHLHLPKSAYIILVLVLTVTIMSADLLKPGMISGYDTDYHLLRIESISEAIKLGQIPVRVNPLFLNGYGYASSLFYPDLFLYLPAVLRVFGLSMTLSMKVFLVLVFAVTFLSAYWCGRTIFQSNNTALLSAVIFSLSQYLLTNVYIRGAIGEVQAFMFLPLIAAGLYSLIFENFEKYWMLALGFIGLFYSHLISVLIAALIVASVSLFRARSILADKIRLGRIAKFILITLLTTIATWLPLFEQLQSGTFQFSQSTYMARASAVPLTAIFSASRKFTSNHVAFGLHTLVLCLSWFAARKLHSTEALSPFTGWGLGIGAVLLFIVSDKFPWEWISGPLNIIQFPWRLYSFAAIFFSFSIGGSLNAILPGNLRRLAVIMLIAFLGIPALWIGRSQHRELLPDHFLQAEHTFFINNGEWLPQGTEADMLRTASPQVLNDAGQAVPSSRAGHRFMINPADECETLDLPLIYYSGYAAKSIDADGTERPLVIKQTSPANTVRVVCPVNRASGTIMVSYAGTFLQHASLYLNLISLVAIGLVKRFKPDWLD